MKRIITIICENEIPVKHLLNDRDYTVLTAQEDENIFTLVEKQKSTD